MALSALRAQFQEVSHFFSMGIDVFGGIVIDDADNSSIAMIFGRSSGVVATSGHIFFDINNVDIGNKRFDVSDNMK